MPPLIRTSASASAVPDRQVLALDALSKLTRQFARHSDFSQLIEIFILTVTGQFTITSAFAMLQHPGSTTQRHHYYGTGTFREHPLLPELVHSFEWLDQVNVSNDPILIDELTKSPSAPVQAHVLAEAGTHVIVPLVHDDVAVGLIGLGSKVGGKSLDQQELALLATLANTVTPLLVNSFLFLEIVNLKAWYLDLLDSVQQGVFVFDGQNQLKKINTAGVRILSEQCDVDVHVGELNGQRLDQVFTETIFPGWPRRLLLGRHVQKQRVFENLVARHGERERVFNVRVTVIRRERIEDSDLVVTLDDVTEQKENEHRMFDLEKFAEKGMMASAISHELNNLLALILGGVELAQMVITKGDLERAQKSLARILKAVHRMERFTAGLMDYARFQPQKKDGDLNTIVDDVLSFVSIQKRFKRVQMEFERDDDLRTFDMDADQIAQLLLNFLNNAVDAIGEPPGDDGMIQLRTEALEDRARLLVSDNGCGIPDDVKRQLFKCHLTTKESGHGYGLVTCARIIEGHGGTVEIESEPGKGTTFILEFPYEVPEDPDAPTTGQSAAPAGTLPPQPD